MCFLQFLRLFKQIFEYFQGKQGKHNTAKKNIKRPPNVKEAIKCNKNRDVYETIFTFF